MAFLKILLDNLRKGPATEAFPFGEAPTPPAYRGKVAFDADTCTGCKMCEHVCAGGAIRFAEDDDGLHFLIWHNTCISCGLCEYYCPTKAITLTNNWHLAHPQSEKYTQIDHGTVAQCRCTECGTAFLPAIPALMDLAYRGQNDRTKALAGMCPDCRRRATLSGARS
ncbi:4Fe-4S ferredoxin [Rhodobacter sp. TJ_12]|uniref:4Fe-4S binding protein n=1 Tax=Rhodobacter sp. TJ_12 TaxID=2029399 RepID=UPI001CBD9D62|nr:4Fe-4S binding protein [Rhodobacter sp. TJ_12]MBZ4021531.1 4Fe-4S ferredoxin [Rhodobacter sp. TJ_12]